MHPSKADLSAELKFERTKAGRQGKLEVKYISCFPGNWKDRALTIEGGIAKGESEKQNEIWKAENVDFYLLQNLPKNSL